MRYRIVLPQKNIVDLFGREFPMPEPKHDTFRLPDGMGFPPRGSEFSYMTKDDTVFTGVVLGVRINATKADPEKADQTGMMLDYAELEILVGRTL